METSPLAALSTLRTEQPRDFFRTVAELGIQAAEALDHAHQMGIVHRDIKPSNLMLESVVSGPWSVAEQSPKTTDNGQRTPLKLFVTDFGLARIESDATAGLTMTGDLLGTLRYMSPEQAEGRSAFLDHRTDIYSLGVTLYELLTLRPAFPAADRQTLLQQIATEEPAAPRRLNSSIPTDLETIVLKAIAKDPRDRYATARGLVEDLRRFVGGEPVHAKSASRLKRIAKWSRRHPRALIGIAGVLLVVLLAALTTAGIAMQERSRTAAALKTKDEALTTSEENLQFAIATVDDLYTSLAITWMTQETAPTTTQQRFLQRALDFYRRILQQPRTTKNKLLAARVLAQVGRIEQYLGNTAQAASTFRESIELSEDLVARQPNQTSLRKNLPSLYRELTELHLETGDTAAALAAADAAVEHLDHLKRQAPWSPQTIKEQIGSDHSLVALYVYTDQLDLAEAAVQRAAKGIKKLGVPDAFDRFLESRNGYLAALVAHRQGDFASARDHAKKALTFCRVSRIGASSDARPPVELELDLLLLLGEISESEGALEAAAEFYRRALEVRRLSFHARLAPADLIMRFVRGQNPKAPVDKGNSFDGQFERGPFCSYIETELRLVRVLNRLGRPYEAEYLLHQAKLATGVIWSERIGAGVLRYHVANANVWAMQAELLHKHRPDEAQAARDHAVLIWRDTLARFPYAATYKSGVHGATSDFELFRGLLPPEVAETLSAQSAHFMKRIRSPKTTFAGAAARLEYDSGSPESVIRLLANAGSPTQDRDQVYCWLYQAMAHASLGEHEKAREWLGKAKATMETIEPPHVELVELRDTAEQLLRDRTASPAPETSAAGTHDSS
jgi:tetratricopeptide (TPR) repeat protein